MMYCSVDEAFDNPVKQQTNNIQTNKQQLIKSVEDYQQNNSLDPPHTTNNYFVNDSQPHIIQDEPNNNIIQFPVPNQSYFSAQGDYTRNYYDYGNTYNNNNNNNNNNMCGTKISDLKSRDESAVSIPDSSYSDTFRDTQNSSYEDMKMGLREPCNPKFQIQKYPHNYYINKFIDMMMEDSDNNSMVTSKENISTNVSNNDNNYQIYDHIQKCKYCRVQINQKIKQHYNNKYNLHPSVNKQHKQHNKKSILESFNPINTIKETFSSQELYLGYELKEIVIIILVGIIIIFILDLFVKIGKKTTKLDN